MKIKKKEIVEFEDPDKKHSNVQFQNLDQNIKKI